MIWLPVECATPALNVGAAPNLWTLRIPLLKLFKTLTFSVPRSEKIVIVLPTETVGILSTRISSNTPTWGVAPLNVVIVLARPTVTVENPILWESAKYVTAVEIPDTKTTSVLLKSSNPSLK